VGYAILGALPNGLDVSRSDGAFLRSTGGPPSLTDHGLIADPLDFSTSSYIAQNANNAGASVSTEYEAPAAPSGTAPLAVTYWAVHDATSTSTRTWRIEHTQGSYTTLVQDSKADAVTGASTSAVLRHTNILHPEAYPDPGLPWSRVRL
jgi:hypothetical protein